MVDPTKEKLLSKDTFFDTFGGGRKKFAEKFKNDTNFIMENLGRDFTGEITDLSTKIENVWKGIKPMELPPLIETEEAEESLKRRFDDYKKDIKKEVEELNKAIKDVEKEIDDLPDFKEIIFKPVDIGDDPGGMQKVLDITGELSVEISNQVGRVADSIDKSTLLLDAELKKADLEDAID